VDTSDQALQVKVQRTTKRHRTVEERRKIVEETLLQGASVSRVARRHDVNANQVFHWRKLYHAGRLGSSTATRLLSVQVDGGSLRAGRQENPASPSGTLEIQVARGTLRVAGNVEVAVLRTALECLIG
jgi:transposase